MLLYSSPLSLSGAASPRSPRQDRADGFPSFLTIGLPMVWMSTIPSAFFFEGGDLTFRVSGVDYKAFLKNFPFLKRLRVWLTGIRSVSFFCVFGLDFRVYMWYCTALLSDAGDVPVPVCRWFRTCFHRLFFAKASNSFTHFLVFYGVFLKNSQIPKGYRETGYIWAKFDFREMVWEFGNYSREREFFNIF